MNNKKIEFLFSSSIIELKSIFNLLEEIKEFYPNFQFWFYNKLIPDIILNDDKIILMKIKNEIIGISIIKKSENKIRTLFILEKYRNKGYIKILFIKTLEFLNEKPFCSVPEEFIDFYQKLFNKYNFKLTQILKDYYRKGKIEYVFNQILDKKQSSL